MKQILTFAVAVSITAFITTPAFSQGRGGGGMSRGGAGFSRPAVHGPSMSRPNISRPSMPVNRPNMSRPNVSNNLSNINRPNIPMTRPNMPNNGPNFSASRPNLPNTQLPNINSPGLSRPNSPELRPGAGNLAGNQTLNRPGMNSQRPNFPSVSTPINSRPSASEMKDFLNLPGGDPGLSRPALSENRPNRPSTLPEGLPNRLPESRPNTLPANRPNIDRSKMDVNNIRNRLDGGHNVNIGNINVDIRNNNINNIRNNWANVNNRPFDRNWWLDPGYSRPVAQWRWHAGWGRYPTYWCWRPCTWTSFGTWFAWTWPQPITYGYGTNVVYRDNYVYLNDQQVASAPAYYEQASKIAESIPQEVKPESVEWMPLGVYSIADAEGSDMSMLLQLAVSKEGILAGTFSNRTNDKTRPVEGMVDRKTQRAAWHFTDEKNSPIVMEAGIYDLTKEETPALLHFDQDNTQNWLLVRLPAPKE